MTQLSRWIRPPSVDHQPLAALAVSCALHRSLSNYFDLATGRDLGVPGAASTAAWAGAGSPNALAGES